MERDPLFPPAIALTRVSDFQLNPVEASVALASVADSSRLLERLLAGDHSTAAGRRAGALRHVNRTEVASDIIATMKAAG